MTLTQMQYPSYDHLLKGCQVFKNPRQFNHHRNPNGKRIITRNSFEVYEDQMESLRKLSFQDKMEGKLGSMSAMVREAIETYLEKRAKEKQTERPNG